MSQTAKAQEPSMEEILASIRRIIADDDSAKTPAKAAEPPKPAPASARPAAPAARPAAAAPPPRPAPPPAISAQDDIDSMFAMPEPRQNGAAASVDILDLTAAMEAPAEAPGLRRIDAMPDVVEAPPEPEEPPTVEEARRQFQRHTGADRNLLSPGTTAAVDSAFNSLAHTVLVQNARTLEDLVKEMLQPLLKSWLDDNLPGLVERLVKAEIERVSRGRG
jgi:cell pole-organizing protein PopZ